MSWRPARALEVLRSEIKAQFPIRDTASDGAIGDQAHQSRRSHHNPDANGVVRARDYDEDLEGAGDPDGERLMDRIANHLRILGHNGDPRLNGGGDNGYIIYEGRIAGGGKGWAWRPYSGPNAHKHHMHVSVGANPAGYDSTASWGIASLFNDQEHDMFESGDRQKLNQIFDWALANQKLNEAQLLEKILERFDEHVKNPNTGGGTGGVDVATLREQIADELAERLTA